MRGARPSGREELIELMVDSAVFLIGRESINDGKRPGWTRWWPQSTYVQCYAPQSSQTVGEPVRQTAYLTRDRRELSRKW
jgi:hypothetical protein